MGLFYYYTCEKCCQVKAIKYFGDDLPPKTYTCSCGEILVRIDYSIIDEIKKTSYDKGLKKIWKALFDKSL